MTLAKADLIAALRLRYDHYSAQSIFEATLAYAGLADQAAYDDKAITAFRAALAKVGDRIENVEARIVSLLEGQTPSPPLPAEPPPPQPAKIEAAEPKPEKEPKAKKREKHRDSPKDADVVDAVETTIALAGVDVAEGEQVLVCGDSVDLGDWDPARARTMKRDGDTWLATIRVPKNADLAFKFLRRAADGTVTWESGDNRNLEAKPRVDATWRSS